MHLLGKSYVFVRCHNDQVPDSFEMEQPEGYNDLYCEENNDYKDFLEWKKEALQNDPKLADDFKKFFHAMKEKDVYAPEGVSQEDQKKYMNCIRCFKLEFGKLHS